MTKRPQRRFTSRKQILEAIDALKAQQTSECLQAETMDREADALYKWLGEQDIDHMTDMESQVWHERRESAYFQRNEAQRLRTHQQTIIAKLGRLKDTLAAFDTAPMPFMSDGSVVLQ